MLQKIKTLLQKLGFNLEGKTDEEILTIAKDAGLGDESKPAEQKTIVHNKDVVDNKDEEIKALKAEIQQVLSVVGELKASNDNATKAMKDRAEKDRAKEIKELIEAAIADGRIPNNPEKKSAWEKRFQDSYEVAKETLSEIPANKSVNNGQNKNGKTDTGNSSSTVSADGKFNPSDVFANAKSSIADIIAEKA